MMDNDRLTERVQALEERTTGDFNSLRHSQIQRDNAARTEIQALRRQLIALEVRIETLERERRAK